MPPFFGLKTLGIAVVLVRSFSVVGEVGSVRIMASLFNHKQRLRHSRLTSLLSSLGLLYGLSLLVAVVPNADQLSLPTVQQVDRALDAVGWVNETCRE